MTETVGDVEFEETAMESVQKIKDTLDQLQFEGFIELINNFN